MGAASQRVVQPEGTGRAYREPTVGERTGTWALESLRTVITLILIGLVLLLVLPGFMHGLENELRNRPWPSLGWGVVAYAGFFFVLLLTVFVMLLGAIVFGLLTLGGLSATMVWGGLLVLFALILGFVLATTFVAKIVVGMVVGQWMLSKAQSPLAQHRYLPMVIGVALTVLVIALLTFPLIPGFLGGMLNFVLVLFGLGTIWLWLRQRLQKKESAVA